MRHLDCCTPEIEIEVGVEQSHISCLLHPVACVASELCPTGANAAFVLCFLHVLARQKQGPLLTLQSLILAHDDGMAKERDEHDVLRSGISLLWVSIKIC